MFTGLRAGELSLLTLLSPVFRMRKKFLEKFLRGGRAGSKGSIGSIFEGRVEA